MRVSRALVVMAMVAGVVAGCAGPTGGTEQTGGSGVAGRVIVDGGCPVIQEGSPCPDKPMAARLTVARPGSDDAVATVTTGEDGTFRIPLPAGRYVVHATNLTGAILPSAAPVDVEVPDGRYVSVTVAFDSGIR